MISKTALVFPNVRIGESGIVEDFVVLGKSPSNHESAPLLIGQRAHIRTGTIVYGGTTIGDDFTTGDYAKVREKNIIGNNVSVGSNAIIERSSSIGNNVRIHSGCFIPEYTTIDDSVWIGPCVIITNVLHPPCPIFKRELTERPSCLRGPLLKHDAVIGAGAIILPGVVIGDHSLVGAGAVVCADVPAESVVVGSPAKVIGSIKDLKCPPGYYVKGEVYSWKD